MKIKIFILFILLISCLSMDVFAKKNKIKENRKITEIEKGQFFSIYSNIVKSILKLENGYLLFIKGDDYNNVVFISDLNFINEKLFLSWINSENIPFKKPDPPERK